MTNPKPAASQDKEVLRTENDEEYRQRLLARLAAIQTAWEAGGPNPWLTHSLSTTEYSMLAIAARKEHELSASAVEGFLLLQNWQQKWVLERRGLEGLIGTVIG